MYYTQMNFLSLYSEILLIISILLLISYLVIYDYYLNYKIILLPVACTLSILTLIYLLILSYNSFFIKHLSFKSFLVNDYLSNFVKILLIFFLLLLLIVFFSYLLKEKIYNYEFFLIILLSLVGLFLLISSQDLITMYLAIELQSLCFYILATFKQYSNFSTEAGIKYFILGAFSSGILLFGCSILYGFTGLTDFYSLQLLLDNRINNQAINNVVFLGILFVLIGLFFKLSAAPFHMWSPNVYEGTPTVVTAFFAIIPKVAIITLLVRIIINLTEYHVYYINQFILFSAFLSLAIGSLGAIYQNKIKRLLAYSSITHVGFLCTGLAITSIESFYSLFFYTNVYMLLSLAIFTVILNIRKYTNYLKIKKISEFILLPKSNFILSLMLAIILFSIAGIPPLIGFYSKFYIFMSGLQAKYFIIIIFASIISVISALYYIRLIKLMFFKNQNYITFLYPISFFNSILISSIFLVNFYFLLSPDLIIVFIHNVVINLFI